MSIFTLLIMEGSMIIGQQGIEVKRYFILFPTKILNNPKNESSLTGPTMKRFKKRG
jgi:hypothetical protein